MTERYFEQALLHITLPQQVSIRAWTNADFPAIQRLTSVEGWTTPTERPDEALAAWRASWPALVAVENNANVIGFVRALTDGSVTMYIADLLMEQRWRGKGVGTALLEACHQLYPATRFDLLSTDSAHDFYVAHGFHGFRGFRKNYF